MMVRPAKKAPTRKMRGGDPTPKPPSEDYKFPAPIRGLVLDESLAAPGPGGALVLDNWICTTTGVKVRGGTAKYATLDGPVTTLFTYKSTTETFFGATAGSVYNITTVADPDVTPTAAISGQTTGFYSSEQFGTAGGDYLYLVNGSDKAQLFDGTTWTAIDAVSTPAITGVTTANLSHVWSFANRLFFVEKDTKSAWYLPVDSIGGAASEFSLAGIFKKGGSLLFGATWSMDAGDGLDDKCVFVSTEGEVAVYEGTNPASAADWRKAGVYQITRPLGPKAIMQAGGDLLIATEAGMVAISQAIVADTAALSMRAVSSKIAPYWQDQAGTLTTYGWNVIKWPTKNIMIVSQPGPTTDVGSCLVANLQTGAWSRFTGIQTRCLGFFDSYGYFGDADGIVHRMETGGSDNGAIYTAAYLGLPDDMGVAGRQKTITLMRPAFQSSVAIAPQVTVKTNFDQDLSSPPSAAANAGGATWDTAVWDTAIWDGSVPPTNTAQWASIGRTGYAISPEIQVSFGNIDTPNVELVSIDAQYQIGAVVA